MKIDFNNNDNDTKSKAFRGSFKDMMDERNKRLPEFKERIQEHFKNYNGEMVAVITIEEDENGDPHSGSIFVGGVATFDSSMRMLQALDEAKDGITSQMASNIAKNPDMLGDVLDDILKKVRK